MNVKLKNIEGQIKLNQKGISNSSFNNNTTANSCSNRGRFGLVFRRNWNKSDLNNNNNNNINNNSSITTNATNNASKLNESLDESTYGDYELLRDLIAQKYKLKQTLVVLQKLLNIVNLLNNNQFDIRLISEGNFESLMFDYYLLANMPLNDQYKMNRRNASNSILTKFQISVFK